MKKYFMLTLGFLNIFLYAQFSDCNITTNEAKSKYYQLKNLGIDYKFPKGQEVILKMIDIIGSSGLRQLCIDAAYRNNQVGTENQYIYYKNNIKNISRAVFFENYQYLMIFDEIIANTEKHTTFRRPNLTDIRSNPPLDSNNFYSGTTYRVRANKNNKVYFYSRPDINYRKKSYFNTPELVMPKAFDKGFADIEFINSRGEKSTGWIRISDLEH